MDERKKTPVGHRTVRVRAASLRYATHEVPFEREHPMMSAALFADEEKAARSHEEREDLFGGMM